MRINKIFNCVDDGDSRARIHHNLHHCHDSDDCEIDEAENVHGERVDRTNGYGYHFDVHYSNSNNPNIRCQQIENESD